MMSKGRTLNDLSQLPSLFTPQEKEKPFAQQLAEVAARPEPVPDIRDAILDLMDNYRGWTIGDVVERLKSHPEAYLVPTLMSKLAIEGRFDLTRNGTSKINIYTLKKKVIDMAQVNHALKASRWTDRDPVGVRKAPDPKAVIRLEEGMDVSIWKVMADYRGRTASEIRQILAEYRFNSHALDRRLESLIKSNRWFDRKIKPSGTLYTLRRDFPMPAIPNTPMNAAVKLQVPAFDLGKAVQDRASEPVMGIDQTVANLYAPKSAASSTNEDITTMTQTPILAQVPAAPAAVTFPPMAADDHLTTLIWKICADYKPYLIGDITTLVQAVRPSQSVGSISHQLLRLRELGWFDLEQRPIQKRGFIHTLRRNIAMPVLKQGSLHGHAGNGGKTKKTVEQPQRPVASHQNAAVDAIRAMASSHFAPVEPLLKITPLTADAEAPLVDLNIRIRGIPFSFEECHQLVRELKSAGFTGATGLAKISLIQQSVTIKGYTFSADSLNQIVDILRGAGFVGNCN